MREQEPKYETKKIIKLATNYMFTQISAKAGIKKFG